MSKIKICLKKPCLKRAFRTFIQTALGYVITNVTLALGGLDFNDGDVVKNALIGLAVAAVAAGASAGRPRRPVLCRDIVASAPRLCSAARIFFHKIPPIGNRC